MRAMWGQMRDGTDKCAFVPPRICLSHPPAFVCAGWDRQMRGQMQVVKDTGYPWVLYLTYMV
jgi:hypothetical protein